MTSATQLQQQPNGQGGDDDDGMGAEFTRTVVEAMGPATSPRLREVMSALIRHVHDFAREVQLTTDEWMAGVQLINAAGQMSNEKRNEGQLLCDVIGLESLVDHITFSAATKSTKGLTASAILGPFWRHDTPLRENGSSISFDTPADAQVVFMHGRVADVATGAPLADATVEVWQASTNGLYEQQDDEQVEHNLRGVFKTDAQGAYSLYCLRPTPYPVPQDGPAGKLLGLMDRHVFRPAHIHFMVVADGYRSLVTQIFDEDCKYLANDSVFAVKDDLRVRFEPRAGDERASLELEYNINLAKAE
ncbi:Catechol 1,2-dioxygenase [Purpureocillium takamizusanense]|uniref:Catechol 1,2-dioxygenase n=1 Tax=Purpureocillium takamizusanense TaxID=2060973 RepID=A0A9Q8VA99_9HYPO|nr:Catechol 1,2-dioxygenase [Purpureocillium takamizusanense]UNI17586.1 Catechol 1,2-dioxygenase [Purpureocillium takamizusanense]